MHSRETILNAIRQNKPATNKLPEIPVFSSSIDLLKQFQESLVSNGGTTFVVQALEEVNTYLKEHYSSELKICSGLPEVLGNIAFDAIEDPHLLEDVHVAVLQGEWAVAENGAIWISENALPHRILPFITQHLVLVLNAKDIVPTLHHAYEKISFEDLGYGAFIAGPSKTADIEQSLVIGAHGARSLMVYLVQE